MTRHYAGGMERIDWTLDTEARNAVTCARVVIDTAATAERLRQVYQQDGVQWPISGDELARFTRG